MATQLFFSEKCHHTQLHVAEWNSVVVKTLEETYRLHIPNRDKIVLHNRPRRRKCLHRHCQPSRSCMHAWSSAMISLTFVYMLRRAGNEKSYERVAHNSQLNGQSECQTAVCDSQLRDHWIVGAHRQAFERRRHTSLLVTAPTHRNAEQKNTTDVLEMSREDKHCRPQQQTTWLQ